MNYTPVQIGVFDTVTDKAVCIDGAWFPRSQVIFTYTDAEAVTFWVPFWLAKEKFGRNYFAGYQSDFETSGVISAERAKEILTHGCQK